MTVYEAPEPEIVPSVVVPSPQSMVALKPLAELPVNVSLKVAT